MSERERVFNVHDTSVRVTVPSRRKSRIWPTEPNWGLFHALRQRLERQGFVFALDPKVAERHPSISRYHWLGHRETPHGRLSVVAEAFPIGCSWEFYQDVVHENRNGGRYDFDKRRKMPYLIGKSFELAQRTLVGYLTRRGFEDSRLRKPQSAYPDPLAYFNGSWNFPSDWNRGVHRFVRDETGWPAECELRPWRREDATGVVVHHGESRYFRDHRGRLMRGTVYGGINGMWLVLYGGDRLTQLSVYDLFSFAHPAREPRRWFRDIWRIDRLQKCLNQAVARQDFERAIKARDALKRLSPQPEKMAA